MVLVRPATVGDASCVADLVDALLVELSGASSKCHERLITARHLLTLSNRIFGFIALDREEPVGVMMISESASIYASGMFGVITELYVVPDRRSQGIANLLINAGVVLGRGRSWGRLEVGAPLQPAWERSLNFYLRAGFREVGPRLHLML
jgi:GNAT superfamily N-acetyltransferase